MNAIQKERLRLIEEISQQIKDGGGTPDPLGSSDLPDVFPKMQSDLRSLRSEFDETASRIDVLKDLLEKTDNSFDTIGKKDFTSAILKQLEELKKSIGSVNEGTDNLNKNIEEKTPSAFQILIERMQELREQGKDVSESLVDIGDKALNGLAKAFTDAITGAKKFSDAMRAMSKSVIDSLIQMLIQKYIVDAAFGAITNFINPTDPKSGTGSSLGNALNQAADAGYGLSGFKFSGNGGGYTGMGARAGGIDGKGGFPAILHPNETVIDHTKGQGMGTTVNFNISTVDAAGFDQLLASRKGLITSIINNAMNNQGKMGVV